MTDTERPLSAENESETLMRLITACSTAIVAAAKLIEGAVNQQPRVDLGYHLGRINVLSTHLLAANVANRDHAQRGMTEMQKALRAEISSGKAFKR